MKFKPDPHLPTWRELKKTDSDGDVLQVTVTDESAVMFQVNPQRVGGNGIVSLTQKQGIKFAKNLLKELEK